MASVVDGSLQDLNAADGVSDVDRDAVSDDTLGNDDDDASNSVGCIHEPHKNYVPLHSVDLDDRSPLDNSGTSSNPPYSILFLDDVSPIESSRARFLQIVVDHFIHEHVVEVDVSSDSDGVIENDKLNKRKLREVQYEGDPKFVLPLMYVANLYETLVGDVNTRLSSLNGMREKNIGVALEAAGGLYRKLSKKFPRKGSCSFKRRELATSLDTRRRFPELIVQGEKRVRFVVVNGLVIIEKPNGMTAEDTEWFKRLTGRHEVAISARDYKFYSPRHKIRRNASQPTSNSTGVLVLSGSDDSPLPSPAGFHPPNDNQQNSPSNNHLQQIPHQPQFHSLHQCQHQSMHPNQHTVQYTNIHQSAHSLHAPDGPHHHQAPLIVKSMSCLSSLTGCHAGCRLHLVPTSPAKFCDECGSPYLREASKFCSECGTKRLGM